MRRKGLTLIEVTIAGAVSVLLLGIILAVFRMGQTSFFQALDDTGSTRAAYVVPRSIVDRLAHSTRDSVSAAPGAFSFLTAYDRNGRFQTNALGRPQWSEYEAFYLLGTELHSARAANSSPSSVPGPLALAQMQALRQSRGRLELLGVSNVALVPLAGGVFRLQVSLRHDGFRRDFKEEVSLCAAPVN